MKERLLFSLATICIIYAHALMRLGPSSFYVENPAIPNLSIRLQLLSRVGREIATVQLLNKSKGTHLFVCCPGSLPIMVVCLLSKLKTAKRTLQ